MRMTWLSILIVLLCVSSAFGQRDAPVWEAYLPKISVFHDTSNGHPALTVDFLFKKHGGPREHTEHQAYVLVYLKKDEEQILKLAADPELIKKQNEKTKRFLDVLTEKKLAVPLQTQVAKINPGSDMVRYADVRGTPRRAGVDTIGEWGFPFKFTLTYESIFESVQKLGNFNIKAVDVAGRATWYEDKFKLIVFIPVNDSLQATKVSRKIHEAYDFASVMDFETSLLYFRPLPYEFGLKTWDGDTLLVYIN